MFRHLLNRNLVRSFSSSTDKYNLTKIGITNPTKINYNLYNMVICLNMK